MLSLRSKSVFLAISVICCGQAFARRAPGLQRDHIKNIVVFGDSYSDIVSVGDNGTAWPVYAAGYGPFNLFPFAKSGATCSNNLTNRPFPSIMESQLPLYFSEIENGMLRLDPSETVYSLWIGTNDIGQSALLTGDQTPGVTLVDVIECATNWVKILYESGARNFLFQNVSPMLQPCDEISPIDRVFQMIPLENTVLYSKDSYPNQFWTFERNSTEWSIFMTELTTSGNALTELILRDLASTLVGAQIGRPPFPATGRAC